MNENFPSQRILVIWDFALNDQPTEYDTGFVCLGT